MDKKKVLVTAGPVYGRLDDNKLVGNRIRGVWAVRFAQSLWSRGDQVVLRVPDLMKHTPGLIVHGDGWETIFHTGFDDYYAQCVRLSHEVDAAVMAAAVVNWIPANPVTGKMPTEGYKAGDTIDIPFKLAPRVIDEMRTDRCKCVIGCKMLSGSTHEQLIDAAYGVSLRARCNLVIANDLSNLRSSPTTSRHCRRDVGRI